MNLAEILAKKQNKLPVVNAPPSVRDSDDLQNVHSNRITEYENHQNYYTTSIPTPDRTLFLATYSAYIADPYSYNWKDCIDYRDFLLGNATYVLNTFSQLDIHRIFLLYMECNPPRSLGQMTLLAFFLNNLHLCLPGFYQEEVENIIRKNKN